MQHSPARKTGRPLKDNSPCRGRGLRSQPKAHEDLVDELAPDPDMPAADSFLDEAEGFIQTARTMVRGEDRQLRLGETPRAHPFQHALHHPAAEAAFAPAVLDRDSDAADVAVLWEGPCVTIRRTDDLTVRDRDEEHVALAIETGKPPSLLLQAWHLFEHEVHLFSADAVHVAPRGLRVVHPAWPRL